MPPFSAAQGFPSTARSGAPTHRPDRKQAPREQQARSDEAQQESDLERLRDSGLVVFQRANDFQHSADIADLPILARGHGVRVVTVNARLPHHPSLGVANYGLAVDLSEVMNCLLPVGLPQAQQGAALEFVLRSAGLPPWERIIAVPASPT